MGLGTVKNIGEPPVEVRHADLERFSDSPFKSRCPKCEDGVLLVRREGPKFGLSRHDMCIACGQQVVYLDEQIAGEKLPKAS